MANLYLQAFSEFPFPCLLLEPKDGCFYILDANKHFCRARNITAEELKGKESPLQNDKQLESLQKVIKTGQADKIRVAHFDFTESQKVIEGSESIGIENIPIKNEDGDVVQILQVFIDSPNKKEKPGVAQKSTLSHQEYENFVKKNKDGLYSLDAEGKFISVNDGLCTLAEITQEELLGKSFLPFCTPRDKERTMKHFRNALQGENQYFEANFISAKGNPLVLEISLIPMKVEGRITGIYGIAKDKTPFRTTEREYLKIEKKLQALVHEGSDLVGILDPDGTYKFISNTSQKVLGISSDFFIGKNAFDFIHPEDKERVMADFSLLGNKKQIKIRHFRYRDGQGMWRWMETLVTNLLDDPYIEGYVTNTREVTELVEQSRQIKQLYERYTLAAEATEDVIYDWDLETNEVIRFHKSEEKLFGYSRKEIDAPDFWKSNIHPEDLPAVKENLLKHLNDPEQQHIKCHYRFRRADDSYAQIIDRTNIVRDEKGKAIRLIGATSDISDIMTNKEALKMANRRFIYAMKATREMIWDWDITNGRIKRSESFKKIFGYSSPKFPTVEEFWFDKIVEKDREKIRQSLYSALHDPQVQKWREEYCFLKADGEEAYVVDRGYILRDRKGKAMRMVGAVLDVTESQRMMKEIQDQNKVLKEVAWEQAHVVRAPLARMKGLLDLLEEESYEEWSREELVNLIKMSAEEVDQIIGGIVRKTEKIGR